MKLDCLPNADSGRTIVRLYDFTELDVSQLNRVVCELASQVVNRCEVHAMPGVTALSGCKLTFLLKGRDEYLIKTAPMQFECGLSAGGWEDVSGLLEPFSEGSRGYQWLVGSPGEADLLLSVTGEW